MQIIPEQVEEVIAGFAKLPGIGPRTAERLTFYLLRDERGLETELGQNLLKLKSSLTSCVICHNLASTTTCVVCDHPDRQRDGQLAALVGGEAIEGIAAAARLHGVDDAFQLAVAQQALDVEHAAEVDRLFAAHPRFGAASPRTRSLLAVFGDRERNREAALWSLPTSLWARMLFAASCSPTLDRDPQRRLQCRQATRSST